MPGGGGAGGYVCSGCARAVGGRDGRDRGDEPGLACPGLGFAGLKGLSGRPRADAEVRPAVEGHDGAADQEDDDGAQDQ